MNYNSDLNVHACGDTGEFGAFFNLNSAGGGFSYEYLLSPAAAEAVLVAQKRGDQNDVAVLSAMIECAGHVREELEQNP